MLLSSKTTLKLNQVQNSLLARYAGTARHAYNWVLRLCKQILKIFGIDLYLKHLANWSAGEVFEGVKSYHKYEKILAQLQWFHRRQHISSANLNKTQMTTTRLARKIINICQDVRNEIMTYVAKSQSGIRIEICSGSIMTNDCKRVKVIANLGFCQCRIRGSKFVVKDKFYPSHKTCCQVKSSEKILFFVRANLLLPTVWY